MELLPRDLTSYNITIINNPDNLICELEYESKIFYSEISTGDLKSGLVSLTKLSDIIKSNSKQTQPNFTIWLDLILNDTSNTKYLVLTISFSFEFIEFEEKINFREKYVILSNSMQTNKLEQIVKSQSEEITQLKNTISQMSKLMSRLENKIDKFDNVINKIPLFDAWYVIDNTNKRYSIKLPAKINELTFKIEMIGWCKTFLCDIEYFNILGTKTNQHKFIPDFVQIFFHDIKKIIVKPDTALYASPIICKYLKKRKDDFKIDEILTEDNEIVNNLIAHTNYNKLFIKFDKTFDDTAIKAHCKANGIEFGYIYK